LSAAIKSDGIGRWIMPASAVLFTFLFLLAASIEPNPVFHRILFTYNFLYLVLLPGFLLSRRFLPRMDWMISLLTSFVLGTAMLYIILFVADLYGGSVTVVRFFVPAVTLALSAMELVKPLGRDPHVSSRQETSLGRAGTILLIVLLIGIVAAVLIIGDPHYCTSDTPDHMAYIRTISRSHEVFPDRFYYRDGGTLTRDIRKAMGHAYWGTMNALTGSNEVLRVWPLISVIGLIFITIAFCAAGLLLFASPFIGLASAVLFLLFYQGSMGGTHISTIAFPFPFGQIYYVIALAFLPRYLSTGRRETLLLVTVSVLAAYWTHIAHFMISLLIIFIAFIIYFTRFNRKNRKLLLRRTLVLYGTILALNLPYLLIRYLRDYHPNNIIHTHIQATLRFGENLYILNPVVIIRTIDVTGIIAILAIFILWREARRNDTLAILLTGTAAFYVLILNPLLVPFLLNRISYLLLRFEFLAPSAIVTGYLISFIYRTLKRNEKQLPRPVLLIAGALVVLLLGSRMVELASFASRHGNGGEKRNYSSLNLMDLYRVINRDIPAGSVIAADPLTSYCIPAFTDQYVMCPFDQHAVPNDSTALHRIIDTRRLFEASSGVASIAATMAKYGADYLVVNGRIPRSIRTMYWKPDSGTAVQTVSKLRRHPDGFQQLFSDEGVTLFRLDRAALDHLEPEPEPDYMGSVMDEADTILCIPSGTEAVYLRRFELDRLEVRRGESVNVRLGWVKARSIPVKGYVTYVRFDTDFEKSPLYHASYGKIYRKLVEGIKRRRFRFRFDRNPLGGIYPPDAWQLMTEITDRFQIDIPVDVSPGIYDVRIKLTETTQYPNYTLQEILTDNDFYSGTIIGRIIIR
jgi:hypothetical protein